jgi:hypothetical protein
MKIRPFDSSKEHIILGILAFSDKFILTGSQLLYSTGVMNRTPNDIDFALKESLTVDELNHIKDFFNLKTNNEGKKYIDHNNELVINEYNPEKELEKELIQFLYEDDKGFMCKIDFFNKEYFTSRDISIIPYNDVTTIQVLHPSISISYKAKYAFDPRVGESFKHMNDLKDIIINGHEYFRITKDIQIRNINHSKNTLF